jgi:hypothetical protein
MSEVVHDDACHCIDHKTIFLGFAADTYRLPRVSFAEEVRQLAQAFVAKRSKDLPGAELTPWKHCALENTQKATAAERLRLVDATSASDEMVAPVGDTRRRLKTEFGGGMSLTIWTHYTTKHFGQQVLCGSPSSNAKLVSTQWR